MSIRSSFPFIIILFIASLLGGCKSRAVIPNPGKETTTAYEESYRYVKSKARKQLLDISKEWIGTPYAYARAEKGIATDCSGMVLAVYLEAADLKLPRNSAKQAEFCRRISQDDVIPGDLVFFATGKDKSKVSHVGIMLDHDNFIHASSSKGVCISNLASPYYTSRLLLFGRVPGLK